MFSAINYWFWKIRMKIFIDSIDQGIWDAILNDLTLLSVLLKISKWTSLELNG